MKDDERLSSKKVAAVMEQNAALGVLVGLPIDLAIGAACSYLLWASEEHREETRRVLNERVIREGFTGVSLLETFNRVAR